MKKLYTCIFVFFTIVFFFASCSSSDFVERRNRALSFLDKDAAFYFSFSAENNRELAQKIVNAKVPGISSKDSKRISSRISNVYACGGNSLNLVAEGSFPSVAVARALSSKNGWSKKIYTPSSIASPAFVYYENPFSKFELSFPDSDLLCASSDVKKMLTEGLSSKIENQSEWEKWLSSSSADIAFYVVKPSVWMSSLVGKNTGAGCRFLWGELKKVDKNSYSMNLYAELLDSRALPAVKAIFNLAFSGLGLRLKSNGNIIECSIESVSESFILSLFNL